MPNQESIPTTCRDLDKVWQKEDFEEIKELRQEIVYFQDLYKKESFNPERIEASKVTNEIIEGLKKVLSKKIKDYETRYTKTS